jgi:hypothetical protein
MNKQTGFLLLSVLLFPSLKGVAQHKDSASSGFIIALSYAGQLPGGALGQLFGFNSNVQGSVQYKTQENWIYGAGFSYFFGDYLKQTSILDSIATSNGNLVANDGDYPGVSYFEKGFDIQLMVGKLFPVSRNRNSGILTMISAGYLQYHLDIEAPGDWTPQISGSYLQGYDHLTAGVCATEFLGYQYISKRRFVSAFGGFEFTEAMAKSLRFNFETESKDPNYHYSMLSGIRVGWMLPILQDNTKALKFYTY